MARAGVQTLAPGGTTGSGHPCPTSLDGLARRVAHWVAADDQVRSHTVFVVSKLSAYPQAFNVVESDFLREIIRYASTSPCPLADSDIPHRTKLHSLVVEEYEHEIENLRDELQVRLRVLE